MDALNDSASKNRITINVGGFRHETHLNTLMNIPNTRLSWIVEHHSVFDSERKDYFFDRHPGAFAQVLNYFRTGKLHCPTDMCGPMFEEELTFWGIDEKQMEPCCWAKYTQHREAEENLKAFVGPGFESEAQDSDLKRSTSSLLTSVDKESCWQKLQPKVWSHLDKPHSSKLAKFVSYLSCFFISLSIGIFCLSTLPNMKEASHSVGNHPALMQVETVCSLFFTLEFVMRFIFCPSKLKFLKTPMDWLDLLAIIPFYIHLFYKKDIVRMFLVVRVFRLFRFIKLSYGLQIMIHTLKASSHELVLLLLILLIPVVLFSSIVYYIEVIMHGKETDFTSVPISFWWCLITMTTVGYGDMTPQTWPGKLMGGACAVCGVLIVALPISVIGSNFNLYYAHAQARLKLPMKEKHLVLGGVPGLVTKHHELSSRRKKKPTFSSGQQLEQSEELSSIQDSPLSYGERRPDRSNDEICPDSGDGRSLLIPLIQNHEEGSMSDIAPGLSRRRPRRTAATLLSVTQAEVEDGNRSAGTDTSQEFSPAQASADPDPQLANRGPEQPPLVPSSAHEPTETSKNASRDFTATDDLVTTKELRSKEEALSSPRDVPSVGQSQAPNSEPEGIPANEEPTGNCLWRRRSSSELKSAPSAANSELSDGPGNECEDAKSRSSDKKFAHDLQPVGPKTNGTPGHRTLDKATTKNRNFRSDETQLIGNGTIPKASKQSSLELSKLLTSIPPNVRDKNRAVSITLSANETEDILETNI